VAEQGKAGNQENASRWRTNVTYLLYFTSLILLLSLFVLFIYIAGGLLIGIILTLPLYFSTIIIIIILLAIIEPIFIRQKLGQSRRKLSLVEILNWIIFVLIYIDLLLGLVVYPILLFVGGPLHWPNYTYHLVYFPIKIFLSIYWLQHCYGINYYWFWINFTNTADIREILIQKFNQLNIPFNETIINTAVKQIRNLTTNYIQYFPAISKVSFLVTGLTGSILILSFALLSFILGSYIYYLTPDFVCKNNNVKINLCIDLFNRLFLVHFLKWFLLYLSIFTLYIYYSLALLITSNEYLSLVLIIVTTFLVIIVEFFVSREDTASRENMARGPFVGPLVASIIAAPFFALMVFMIANVFLPSTCFAIVSNTNIGSLMNSIAPYYASLLILAAIFGAIPYASTLWAIQYHYECSCPPAEKRGEKQSGAGGSRLPEEK
jgi:hypothetical protein